MKRANPSLNADVPHAGLRPVAGRRLAWFVRARMVSAKMFEEFEVDLDRRLRELGYSKTAREIDGPFGSHFAQFQNGEIAYRLLWDGRENWLALERAVVTPDDPVKWRDISLQRFPSLATPKDGVVAAFQAICAALEREVNAVEP